MTYKKDKTVIQRLRGIFVDEWGIVAVWRITENYNTPYPFGELFDIKPGGVRCQPVLLSLVVRAKLLKCHSRVEMKSLNRQRWVELNAGT